MNEDDLRRVEAARERALAKAKEFYESIPPDALAAQQTETQQCNVTPRRSIDREAIGTVYEQSGWMPKTDYLEMERIIAAFNAGAPTADDAVETMIRFLRESRESIVRARVLAFLCELVKRDAQTPDRIAQIEDAIAPWREGPEDLDILYWASVRTALDSRGA